MNYECIDEIREVEVTEANKLLKKKSHILIKQPVKVKTGDEEKILYIMAKFDEDRASSF